MLYTKVDCNIVIAIILYSHTFIDHYTQLDFAIVKINGGKFQKQTKEIHPIDLGVSTPIKDGDYIHVIQHALGEEISISVSNCKVLGKYICVFKQL